MLYFSGIVLFIWAALLPTGTATIAVRAELMVVSVAGCPLDQAPTVPIGANEFLLLLL
jgi:hypothetical protein